MAAIAEAAGLRVHVYTSPHLIHFNERIRVAGDLIGDRELLSLIEECEDANGDAPITFFEITTAVALLAFSRTPADLVLLETGLGGRLDATNVITHPAATILTPISIDHQGFLGDNLAAIAAEKAGIMKPGAPCITADQDPDALTIIRERSKQIGATLQERGDQWRDRRLPTPGLNGEYQFQNADLAIAALATLNDPRITPAAIDHGVTNAQWPGRLQKLVAGPLIELLPNRWELWLDGGHNPAAGRVLARHAENWSDKPMHLVFGILNSKQPADFLEPLVGHVASLKAVSIDGEDASVSAEEAAAIAAALGIQSMPAATLGDALRSICRTGAKPGRILICGSLYLAANVLKSNK